MECPSTAIQAASRFGCRVLDFVRVTLMRMLPSQKAVTSTNSVRGGKYASSAIEYATRLLIALIEGANIGVNTRAVPDRVARRRGQLGASMAAERNPYHFPSVSFAAWHGLWRSV